MASDLFKKLHHQSVVRDCAALYNMRVLEDLNDTRVLEDLNDTPVALLKLVREADALQEVTDDFFDQMQGLYKRYSISSRRITQYRCPICGKESCPRATAGPNLVELTHILEKL